MRHRLARICSWTSLGERDVDRLRRVLTGIEELPRVEAERASDDQRRERLLAVVEAQHGRVVVAAGGGDLVLGVRQLVLELA